MTDWSTATAEDIINDIRAHRDRLIEQDERNRAAFSTVNHIVHKVRMGELKQEVADKMLRAMAGGAEADYRKLYIAAVRVPLPNPAYHSSPAPFRAQIQAEGLRMALPADGAWNINALGQPRAVYLSPEPDELGQWATTEEWDIWEVDTNGLTWQHDDLNEICYAVLQDIPAEKIRLIKTRRW